MDLSLKHRLLGAAVLIALAVIFVPMFMSSSTAPQKTAEMETSTLAIPPEPDREFQTRVLPIEPPKPETPSSAPAADDGRITTVDTATAPKSEPASPPATTPATPPPTPPPPPPPPPPTPPPPTPPPSPPPSKPVSTPPAAQARTETPKTAAKPVATAPATAESAKPIPGQAANGRHFVFLGVYTTQKNASDLVDSLKSSGFPAFAEASDYQGKPASSVRVGPFENRAAAEAARLRIKKLKPTVPSRVTGTAEDAKADAPPAALPANRAGGWAVQLGALKTVEDANKLSDRLKGAGFATFVDKASVNGSTLWRVRAGPETDRGAADKLRASIKEKLKIDGVLVTQP